MSKPTGLLLLCLPVLLCISKAHSQATQELTKGKAFAAQYQIDSAYAHLQNAVKLSNKGADNTRALIYVHYGKVLKLKEKTDSTFFYFRKSADIYEKHKNADSLLYVTISTAELFRFRDNKDKAEQYIKRAERMLTTSTPPNIRAYYYNRRAGIENMFFSRDYALELSEKVIAMQDKITDKEIVAYSYNELGALYVQKDSKKSNEYYRAALDVAERYNLLIPKADVLVNLCRRASSDQKIKNLEEAYRIALHVNNMDMQMRISNLLFWPYKDKGDYKKAFEYCYIALALQEKIYDSRALAKTAEIERKYNLSKAEEELRYKNAEVRSARTAIILTTIIFALTLVVLLVVAYFLRKTRKNNRKLTVLSEENEFLLSEANHRINNNLQLITIMISDEVRKNSGNDPAPFHKILSKVNSIALLHRHLYKADDKRHVNVGEYLQEVLHSFSEVFAEQGIGTSFTTENILLSNEDAKYMGLLVTELCINTLKYAFEGQEHKQVEFYLGAIGDKIIFRFSDNGNGAMGKKISPLLIQRLCRQLKVECRIDTRNGFLLDFEKQIK
jgi:two-component sensor histidine kinase